ncbi:Cyclic pyranopterin monophosphate synthase [Phycisphaerae bacterium RAS1]|nr:Cyclic pyranopterin monophosphate synthase [Phycisphaerae bacterium RAS1]
MLALPIIDVGAASPHAAPAVLADQAVGPRNISSVTTLRISVTDRCNFRCVYCMPNGGVDWLPREELLTFEEIVAVAQAALTHGIRDFKLTGGEPLLRKDLADLVRLLRATPGVRDLSMTTNGLLLQRDARALRAAGLDRLTISLDTLDPARFRGIAGGGQLEDIWAGLRAAEAAGFGPPKINVVVMRGFNAGEVPNFAALTLTRPNTVRFIEFMPLADSALEFERVFVPFAEIAAAIEARFGPLAPANLDSGSGPARVFRLPGAIGRIGFIHAMSQPFCSTCNRLRLTSDGQLRSCLFDGGEIDLKPLLRPAPAAAPLRQAFVDCVRLKPEVHKAYGTRQMSQIGG